MQARWTRNNRYVLHNKIYYRGTSSPGARQNDGKLEFIPVFFGDEEETQPEANEASMTGDGCAYDLMGRKVATREEVLDGSWWRRMPSGIYIVNGRKLRK